MSTLGGQAANFSGVNTMWAMETCIALTGVNSKFNSVMLVASLAIVCGAEAYVEKAITLQSLIQQVKARTALRSTRTR